MRRVIMTLLATALLVWLLVPRQAPAPAVPGSATPLAEPAVPEHPASGGGVAVVTAAAQTAEPASSPVPDTVAPTPAKQADIGQRLGVELKGVLGGGAGLAKHNPFEN